jgi:hypothetical protein
MDAILELESNWNAIKKDPNNLYHLPPNPNGNMLAQLNINSSQSPENKKNAKNSLTVGQ